MKFRTQSIDPFVLVSQLSLPVRMADEASRRFLREAEDDDDLSHIITLDHLRDHIEEMKASFGRLQTLDEVFTGFMETNDKHESLSEIIATAPAYKRYTVYKYAGIPYEATIYKFVHSRGDTVNIKLCNHGFVYFPHEGE